MIKTYISVLLVVLLAGAQMVLAQENMDDMASAAVEVAEDAAVQQAPTVDESEMLSLLFDKGLEQYNAGRYDDAVALFDAMLTLDEYDSRAVTYKKRAFDRIASKEKKMQSASRADAMADVNAAWNPPEKNLVSLEKAAGIAPADPNEQAIQQMEDRLKSIIVPKLDFRESSIEDVVLFLTETARQLDPSGKGVNVLLTGMETATSDNDVSMAITDINLYDALRIIVEMSSLKFEVKPNAVAIMPSNYVPVSELTMKSYNILPEVGVELESLAGGSGGGADDLFGDAPSSDVATGPIDVASFFSIVDFPEGASAIYQPRFHKLFVKNTPKNLTGIESILADLDEEVIKRRSQQVEIEAKFVEFNEGALEELGFDWNMFGSGTVAGMGLDERNVTAGAGPNEITIDPITGVFNGGAGQAILTDNNLRPGQNVFGSSQRNNTSAFKAIQTGLLASMGGTPAAMLFSNGDIDLQITAMEQEGTADVLSAPKVTTKSGSEAIIRIAETHRYPQDYDVETGQRTAPVVKPQDWEDFDLGVSLKVTPEVDSDSGTIDLALEPEIMKFSGFDPYIVGYNSQQPAFGELPADSSLKANMPFFERRYVQTQVTIDDGHTVVMGGMVDERTETFRDQIPFLGDIPYLGRLFRSEGSRSTKKNLVIYVKATMVDARGMTSAERKLARQ